MSFALWGNKEFRRWGYCIPQADAIKGRVLHPRKMTYAAWERDSAAVILAAVPLALFPEPKAPVSPYRFYSTPLFLCRSPGWVGCDEILCIGPLRPVFLEDSCLSLEDRIPTDFHNHMSCAFLSPSTLSDSLEGRSLFFIIFNILCQYL